jgi:hypothetical protein
MLGDDWATLNTQKVAILGSDDPFALPSFAGSEIPTAESRPAPTAAPRTAPSLPPPPPGYTVPKPPPNARMAAGGPFDPDISHALAGIGGPNDPDASHRQDREHDEWLYFRIFGRPWEYAVYATGAVAGP